MSLLSRLAALLLLAGGIWSAWDFIEAPLLAAIATDRAEIAQDAAVIRQAGQGQAGLGGERRRLAQWDDFIAGASWPLDRASPELMSAQLQRQVQGLAAGAGVQVTGFRALPVHVSQIGDVIGLELDVEASTTSLRAMLFSIEAARPRIFVDRLSIQAPETGMTGEGDLTVQLRLTICALPRSADGA